MEEAQGNQAFCRSCGRLFASVEAFDTHRVRGTCAHPTLVELVLRDGSWCTPADVVQRDKMARARAARTKVCRLPDCGCIGEAHP